MRPLLLFLTLLFAFNTSMAQVELWAKTAGGAGDDEADALAVDGSGNIYVAGFFKSSQLKFGDMNLKNSGGELSDVFLTKIDPAGKVLWAKCGGGLLEEEPLGIALDKSGNVIVRGYFESDKVIFDNVELTNQNPGDISTFIIKYSSDGKVVWAAAAPVLATTQYIDHHGNVFLAGQTFKGVATSFGSVTFTPVDKGLFIAKYGPDGKVLWVKKGTGGEVGSISGDTFGNLYMSGSIVQSVFTMDVGINASNQGVAKTSDAFFLKLNAEGVLQWHKIIAGLGDEEPRAQYVNTFGSYFVVVRYTSIKLKIEKETHKNGGGDDFLLMKYDPTGRLEWAKSAGGSGHDSPVFLVADNKENLIMAGHYYSSKIEFDNLSLSNVGLNDIFLVKFASDGKFLWAKTTGGSHHDYPNGLVTDGTGNIYLIGEFNSSPNKDKITSEFFMEKYDAAGNNIWKSAEHRSESFDFAFGESLDKNSNLYIIGYYGGNIKFAGNNYKSGGNKDIFILKYSVK